MIAGLGSNGFASISSELFEILKKNLDVVNDLKVSIVIEVLNDCIEDGELIIVDGLPVDEENLLWNIVW